MHAQQIIQDLLSTECPSIHAKRRACVADMTQASSDGGLSLMGMRGGSGNSDSRISGNLACDMK